MKTMSWSRYHALSHSFTRIRRSRGCGLKRTRRAAASIVSADHAANGDPPRHTGSEHGLLVRAFRSVITIFRTGVVPRETDI